jgi:DNA-binding beta-propeller fold protein YncE
MRGATRAAWLAAWLAVWLAACLAALLLVAAGGAAAHAQLAASANDAKVKLVDGKAQVQQNAPPDTLAIIDMRASPPKVVAELNVPSSAVGPPSNVAVLPKENLVLVASAVRLDPADAANTIPDDKLSVIDIASLKPGLLKRLGLSKGPAPQPKVIATLQAGKGASGIGLNKAGTLALVANHAEGTVSAFTIDGTTVTAAGKVTVGDEKSGPSAVSFTPDGKTALVTLDGDHKIVVLSINGTTVEPAKRVISAGLRPTSLDIPAKGEVAVVANTGMGGGDADTISVIDLKLDPPRVVNTYTVGPTPVAIKASPDGKYVAVTVANGTNQAPDSPFYRDSGLLQVWTRTGTHLVKAAELAIGKWCRGVAWSNNSRTLLVQCMVEEEITVVRFSGLTGRSLQKVGTIKVNGGPAGIRTAEP